MAHRSSGPNRLLVSLDRLPASRALVGGKGASLSRLLALGMPVPPACALTTAAYRAASVSLGIPGTVAAASQFDLPWIRAELRNAPLPAVVDDAIASAWTCLATDAAPDLALAVRSSATAEDSGEHSFAGLHDTVLDVRSPEALAAAVRECWASLWSDRAVSYRHGTPLADDDAAIAVVIQRLVRADVSFIVFTADPVSGNRDHAVISASWGLGEAIVSGQATPDQVVIGSAGQVLRYDIGAKEMMTIPGESPGGGTREVPVPRLLRSAPVMSEAQATRIATLARDVAAKLGYPADIEGGIAGGDICLFQARPITTLGPPPSRVTARDPDVIATHR